MDSPVSAASTTPWRIVGPHSAQAAACEPILRALPAWLSLIHI